MVTKEVHSAPLTIAPPQVSGRLKLGKETLSVIDGHWDDKVTIKDKKTGTEETLWQVISIIQFGTSHSSSAPTILSCPKLSGSLTPNHCGLTSTQSHLSEVASCHKRLQPQLPGHLRPSQCKSISGPGFIVFVDFSFFMRHIWSISSGFLWYPLSNSLIF